MLQGVATTSSSEDKYGRVRVSCPALWEKESSLLPVLNSVFISKGDVVILFSPENMMQSLFILGKFQTDAVQSSDPVSSDSKQVLFKAHVGGSFVMGTLDEGELHIETDKGLKFTMTGSGLDIDVPKDVNIEVKGDINFNKAKTGSIRGMVNIAQVESLVTALAKDLVMVGSGTNLSTWMGSDMVLMEDKDIKH